MQRTHLKWGAFFALALAGCGDGTGAGSGVALSFSTVSPGAVPLAQFASMQAAAFDDTLVSNGDTLIITKAEIVLREIELERVETTDCDDLVETDDCEEFEAGPVLLDVPLNNGTETLVAIDAPDGSYDEIEFEIHKVSKYDPEDADFRAQYPDMVDKSIRVQGTFNGSPFTYETDLDVEQEFDLSPPLVIDNTTGTTNVTVRIDLDAWFRDGSGNLLDPNSGNKGGSNEDVIKENIKQSMEAFEDEDRDGDDSDEDHS
jgi:hypothetical protein